MILTIHLTADCGLPYQLKAEARCDLDGPLSPEDVAARYTAATAEVWQELRNALEADRAKLALA